ncbi:glycoside hydrolase family 28 protein [Flavobacterium nackdongense]|uniref:Glycoside hydrolase family 28 protein n=1 Tax=Flavobacterium nackdongense TaxID=2547394 RepID=A0A4P6YGC4_9FLAO|nr:glycoside hydrolase family 28 protein [Flavobacterium nackdongense]QBN19523.1 glycoside hydrolase family 28 protein [Flavobacterium nackdongense]
MKLYKLFSFQAKNALKTLALVLILLDVLVANAQQNEDTSVIWKKMEAVLKSMKTPVFPNKTYSIINYGAKSSSTFDNTLSIKKAIQDCSKNGGGTVLIPKGTYFTRPIHLESNVNLHLEDGAELLFSANPKDFPLVHTTFEGTECMNYSPLIYANNKTNVAVTGKGTINGQASNDNWWSWCGKDTYGWKEGMPKQQKDIEILMSMAEKGIEVKNRIFGDNHYLRPNFVEFFECTNVLIKDINVINAPFWVLHPMKSTNVIVDGVNINSHGPNNDGCDPEYSKNVNIKNCTFNTGDDCIAIKAGRDADGRRVGIKSENIIVQNCKMFDGHGGVTIGSEMSAGVSNVYVENCVMNSPNLDVAIRLKTNSKRGGLIENFYVRNIEIGEVNEAVLKVDMFYNVHGNQEGSFIPRIENISLENVKVKYGGKFSILALGRKDSKIKNITLNNVLIEKVNTPFSIENVENLKFINTYINGALANTTGM